MSKSEPILIHKLSGCRPTPLAHYLKALGILRIVAAQCDQQARGWWKDNVFHLATSLNSDALERFFLYEYAPTPLLAPWNGGSGFYPKDNKTGMDAIVGSKAERFLAYRIAANDGKKIVAMLRAKPSKGDEKNNVISECRRRWRGPALQWLDAALALGGDGEPVFPAMLGTGGNDGRLDFTTNFMLRLVSIFDLSSEQAAPQPESIFQLRTAIWETPTPTLKGGAIGQFLPGAAGGPNGTNGFSGGVGVNPWDYVLMLEGAVLFSSGLARRCQASRLPQAAAPFAVRSSGSGYGSAASSDTGPRGEQWMPLWLQPTGLRELSAMLREGRSQINGKAVGRGTDMARAIAKLGVARGIHQFERYGYIERNGLSNLAVPLGRFQVKPRPNQNLLDAVAPWIDRLRQAASDKVAPNSIARAYRACELAVFNCANLARRSDFLSLLVALGQAEDRLVATHKFSADKCPPLPELSGQWVPVITENSAEFRLALALAAQHGPMDSKSRWASIRMHWVPMDASGKQFDKGEQGIIFGPEQAAIGLDLERSVLTVMHRRLLALSRGATRATVPLRLIRPQFGAHPKDIQAFINYQTDDARILAYARGLMAIRFSDVSESVEPIVPGVTPLGGLAIFGVLRMALPVADIALPNGQSVSIRCNPVVVRRLQSGDLSGAFQMAIRQLSNAGLRPKIGIGVGTPELARRLAAAMIFGVSPFQWTRLALSLTAPELPDDSAAASANATSILDV